LIFHKQARGLQREEEFLPFQYGIKVVYTYIYIYIGLGREE
jgi:hypothetical protein